MSLLRRWRGAPPSRPDVQRHHLIPLILARRPQMQPMFRALEDEGFHLHHFAQNGQLLPASEAGAMQAGHALHRGPHHGYSDVVTARVERIRQHFATEASLDVRTARRTAKMRLTLLQQATRRALTDRHRGAFRLNKRDPMRIFADRPYLDKAIDMMFAHFDG